MNSRSLIFRFFLIPALACFGFACGNDLTGKTEGQVVKVAIDRERKAASRKTTSNKRRKRTTTSTETEIDYRYQVDGRSYDGYSEKDGDVQPDFQTGTTVVVCYNPKDPSESDVLPSGARCG